MPLHLPDQVPCPASPNTLSVSCSSSYFACPALSCQPLTQPLGYCLPSFAPLTHFLVFMSSGRSQPPPCRMLSTPSPLVIPTFSLPLNTLAFLDPILSILPNSHSQVKTKLPQHFPDAGTVLIAGDLESLFSSGSVQIHTQHKAALCNNCRNSSPWL